MVCWLHYCGQSQETVWEKILPARSIERMSWKFILCFVFFVTSPIGLAQGQTARSARPADSARVGGMTVIEGCFTEFHRRAAVRLFDNVQVRQLYDSRTRSLAIEARRIICRHAKEGHYDGSAGYSFVRQFNRTRLSKEIDRVSQEDSLDYFSMIAAFVSRAERKR